MTADIEDFRVALDSVSKKIDSGSGIENEDATNYGIKDLPVKDDAVIFKLDNSLVMGIVDEVKDNDVSVIPLEQLKISGGQHDAVGKLWRYPVELTHISISPGDILPCFPSLELYKACSKWTDEEQIVVFRLLNDDILQMFCSVK